MNEQLDILYLDDDIVVIDKPSGLLVHRSPIDRRERRFALQLLRDQLGQRVYPAHRLDKPTSGLLVFGLHSDAASRLQQQFRERRVSKTYHAIVRGYLDESGRIDSPLSDKREAIEKGGSDQVRPPQSALTEFRTVDRVELPIPLGRYSSSRYSLVELKPHTGRKHQLRRHMKQSAHHIIGDTRYGDGKHNQLFRDQFDNQRLLLFATRLCFEHPFDEGRGLQLDARIPVELQPLFEALGWSRLDRHGVTEIAPPEPSRVEASAVQPSEFGNSP
ncbi:pseudouridine synthase [Motiliproteus sp.]|uniref:pseudouridine synthase n=1 Tax=Motiliproteus sp. TaxID=1898955 RepID=UPI003BAA1F48